jgi:hypothetical protein
MHLLWYNLVGPLDITAGKVVGFSVGFLDEIRNGVHTITQLSCGPLVLKTIGPPHILTLISILSQFLTQTHTKEIYSMFAPKIRQSSIDIV